MEMLQSDFRKLQLIELELLLELDRICRKYDIQYSLSAGTALGAVRHRGFIPWDDDMDTRMKREEFDKFVTACEKELDKEKYFLQTAKSDPEYRWGYAKLRRKNTEYLRKGQEVIKCMSGVSIDIFVIDNVNDNTFIADCQHYIRRACIKTLWSVIGVTQDPVKWKRVLYRFLRHIPKQIPLGIIEAMGRRNNKKNTEFVCCLSFFRPDPFLKNYGQKLKNAYDKKIEAKWFEESVDIIFEGFPVKICSDYMTYLERKYANMWEFPPEGQRTLHPPISYNLNVEVNLRGKNIDEYMNKEYEYLTKENWENIQKEGI